MQTSWLYALYNRIIADGIFTLREYGFSTFLLLWPWPWPDDLHMRTWNVIPGDTGCAIMNFVREGFGMKGFVLQTDRQTRQKLNIMPLYRVAQKWHSFWYALTSSNINRFLKLFHCQNQKKMCGRGRVRGGGVPSIFEFKKESFSACWVLFLPLNSIIVKKLSSLQCLLRTTSAISQV